MDRSDWKFLGQLILFLLLFFGVFTFLFASSNPNGHLKPGNEIVVLSDKTVIQDGLPCREYRSAFVSATGKEGQHFWSKAERVIYPLHTLISVIYKDGTIEWVQNSTIIALEDVTPELVLCHNPIPEE